MQIHQHGMCSKFRFRMIKSLIDHDAFLHFGDAMVALSARQRMEMSCDSALN